MNYNEQAKFRESHYFFKAFGGEIPNGPTRMAP